MNRAAKARERAVNRRVALGGAPLFRRYSWTLPEIVTFPSDDSEQGQDGSEEGDPTMTTIAEKPGAERRSSDSGTTSNREVGHPRVVPSGGPPRADVGRKRSPIVNDHGYVSEWDPRLS
jgi:hypothetical protein